MPESTAYRAGNLGGIMGTGERFDSRPEVDYAGLVQAAGQAFNNNRQGVLTKAVTMAHLKMAQQQQQNEQAQHDQEYELRLREMGYNPPDPTQSAAPAPVSQPAPSPIGGSVGAPASTGTGPTGDPSQGNGGNPGPIIPPVNAMAGNASADPTATDNVPVPAMAASAPVAPQVQPTPTPAPAPVTFGGTGKYANWVQGVPAQVQRGINQRRSALQEMSQADPTLFTPAEMEMGASDEKAYTQLVARADKMRQAKSDASDRYNSLEGATGPDGKPLQESMRKALSVDPLLYRKYNDSILSPKPDRIEQARELHQITEGDQENHRDEDRVDRYVQQRITKLTAPQSDGVGGKTEGMDFDTAQKQAIGEARKLYNQKGAVDRLFPSENAPAQPKSGAGNVKLGSAQPGQIPPEAIQEHQALAGKYQQALSMHVDPALALQAYEQDNMALKKKYGMTH